MTETLRLHDGVHVEFFDDAALVLNADGATVHRVDAKGAALLALVTDGITASEVPANLTNVLHELEEIGVIEASPQWSRRKVIGAGAVGAAAATASSVVGSFMLPSVAAAG